MTISEIPSHPNNLCCKFNQQSQTAELNQLSLSSKFPYRAPIDMKETRLKSAQTELKYVPLFKASKTTEIANSIRVYLVNLLYTDFSLS